MLAEFEKKVAGFVGAEGLFVSARKVLLAVSGGADSIALLSVMCALGAQDIVSGELVCAHINHQLRGTEADDDEDFVVSEAARLGLAMRRRRLDVRGFARVNKLSIETAARKLRIESLTAIAEGDDCDCIATGHQKDDNAETLVQRILRGTGFRGLGGIWPERIFEGGIKFVRPLLCVRREEIVRYLKRRRLTWRVDRTNEECTYRRNFVRHRLLPALQQESSGSIVEQLSQLAGSARRFYSLVCSRAEQVWSGSADCAEGDCKLDLEMFLSELEGVQVELIRRGLGCVGSGERDMTREHYERILKLAQQNVSGRKVELPGGFLVRREYGRLIFSSIKKTGVQEKQICECARLQIPGATRFSRYAIQANIREAKAADAKFGADKPGFVERFDFDKVKLPLAVRFRRAGDRFIPLGLAEEKKVGKFLTAAKVAHKIRRKALVVADSEKVIWLWPIRISEQAKITSETRKILELKITEVNMANEGE